MTNEAPPTEELAEAVELSDEQKRARRRLLAQQAIALAMQGRWDETLAVNRDVLALFPDDPEASNRIGNALSELNRVAEAIEAYENTLEAQPTNVIAQRNVARLRRIVDSDVAAKPSQKLPPSFFVEEVGKTGIATLSDVTQSEAVARVAAGDEVALKGSRGRLEVTLMDGEFLGAVESSLAERLVRLLEGGNTYQAGVVMAEPGRLRIMVRETRQSPENEGRISFPPKTASVRAYTRDSLVRRGAEDEDDNEAEASDLEAEDLEDEDENPAEFGFSETSLTGDVDAS